MLRRLMVAGALVAVVADPSAAAEPATHVPGSIDFSMFYLADIRDSPECAAHVADGKLAFADTVTNPAITCPDAFAWKLFAETVAAGFWENWSTNRQVWPSNPWPRCAPGESGNCCPSVAVSNETWPEHCPVFPGSTAGAPEHVVGEPSKAHQIDLADAAVGDADRDGAGEWEDVPAILRNAVIGAVQNELIYRNQPMVDYIFDRSLYHQEGLAAVYDNFVRALSAYAPRWPEPDNPVAAHPSTPPLANIVFPVKSVMVKVNWLTIDQAPLYGIDPNDPDNPFITMDLVPMADDNKPPAAGSVTKQRFILLSLHISSKDLPNWFWATFEHVANQGRCDFLGCNDSFGHINTETLTIDTAPAAGLAEPARNYTPPHAVAKVDGANQVAFDLAGRYVGVDRPSPALDALFAAFGIGAGDVNTSGLPTVGDKAWRSYRLKGTQTNFVTLTGRPTRLGNSVTEAGFVNRASCITCHSRAGLTREGLPPLAIFADTVSDAGIPESVLGMPLEPWFDLNAYWGVQGLREAPGIRAVPSDFVWGFRNACPMTAKPIGPSWCVNVTSK